MAVTLRDLVETLTCHTHVTITSEGRQLYDGLAHLAVEHIEGLGLADEEVISIAATKTNAQRISI
ncbi:MAG: hypothetical protein EOM23_03455 [Candidatus Moranbacteria bacterium]|nr:hypothetical protein [Candidatus Moranbacteria bacterium]